MFQSVDDVKIARDLMFSFDHFPLAFSYSSQNRRSQTIQHMQQDHLSLTFGIGSRTTIGTMPSDNPRYLGRTGRQFPDFKCWLVDDEL